MSSSVGVGPSSTPGPSSAAGAAASTSTQQGPMGASSTRGGTATATGMGTGTDLWSDILQSASRQKGYGKKNVLLLSERSRGRTHLLTQLTSGGTARRRQNKRNPGTGLAEGKDGRGTLALGYEVMEVREEGDEEGVPPVSIFYPPSSHQSMTSLIPRSLPPDSLNDTVVMIVLDWTKPSTMINELLHWLVWVDNWAASTAGKGQAEEMRERLQSHLQHYVEPVAPTPGATSPGSTPALPSIASMAYGNAGPLLPLGPGTLTLNSAGVPIVVVLTRADLMDSAGEGLGMKGAAWEERTDWVQQVLRTICLAYGASLFYTAPTQPTTYTLLRSYLLHRLYSIPPPLTSDNSAAQSAPIPTSHASARFPFPHRANVLDRDAVMVPSGWDSWGKINVLREGFDPARVGSALEASLGVLKDGQGVQDAEGLERIWESMIPEVERVKLNRGAGVNTTVESEQSFLSRHLDALLKDPNRDPRQSFRHAANTASANASHSHSHSASGAATGAGAGTGAGTKDAGGGGEMDRESRYAGYGGVVGPIGTGGLSLPGVEKAMVEMEGGGAEEIRERFARLGRRESARGGAGLPGPLSPTGGAATGDRAQPATNEALHNFFQGLLANKGKSATPSRSTSAAKNPVTEDKRERTVSGGSAKTDRS